MFHSVELLLEGLVKIKAAEGMFNYIPASHYITATPGRSKNKMGS